MSAHIIQETVAGSPQKFIALSDNTVRRPYSFGSDPFCDTFTTLRVGVRLQLKDIAQEYAYADYAGFGISNNSPRYPVYLNQPEFHSIACTLNTPYAERSAGPPVTYRCKLDINHDTSEDNSYSSYDTIAGFARFSADQDIVNALIFEMQVGSPSYTYRIIYPSSVSPDHITNATFVSAMNAADAAAAQAVLGAGKYTVETLTIPGRTTTKLIEWFGTFQGYVHMFCGSQNRYPHWVKFADVALKRIL